MSDPTPAELAAHGGWALKDPRPVAAENPDSFEMPTAEELAQLTPGDEFRAWFHCLDLADDCRDGYPPWRSDGRANYAVTTERMWLLLLERRAEDLVGLLQNLPYASHTRLAPNVVVTVPVNQVIATGEGVGEGLPEYLEEVRQPGAPFPFMEEDDATMPLEPDFTPVVPPVQVEVVERAGTRFHRAHPFSGCLIANDLGEGDLPLFGVREQPRPDRGDSGWMFWSRTNDLDVIADSVGLRIGSIAEACELRPEVWHFMGLPPGWGFTMSDGYAVYPLEED